ncbi:MAG: PA14 domain-containing protein, partial [Planctomycetota bacterium]
MKRASLIVMLFLICLMGFPGQVFAAEKPGLVGIQYGSEDFTNAENLVILDSLDKSFTEDDDYGRQWSGKWEGFIKCPFTGKVTFTAETDQNLKVIIGSSEIINTQKGRKSDTLMLTKKMKFPVKVSFVKTGDEYDCYLRIKWSWPGQEPVALSASSLVYKDDVEKKFS